MDFNSAKTGETEDTLPNKKIRILKNTNWIGWQKRIIVFWIPSALPSTSLHPTSCRGSKQQRLSFKSSHISSEEHQTPSTPLCEKIAHTQRKYWKSRQERTKPECRGTISLKSQKKVRYQQYHQGLSRKPLGKGETI